MTKCQDIKALILSKMYFYKLCHQTSCKLNPTNAAGTALETYTHTHTRSSCLRSHFAQSLILNCGCGFGSDTDSSRRVPGVWVSPRVWAWSWWLREIALDSDPCSGRLSCTDSILAASPSLQPHKHTGQLVQENPTFQHSL